jgi:hypothetical protein
MTSEIVSRLKNGLMRISDDSEVLTFGELKVGQFFIGFPLPGDNSGHGGFRKAHYVFVKTHQSITEAEPGMPYGIPHGRAVNRRGVPSDYPNSMPVILVE